MIKCLRQIAVNRAYTVRLARANDLLSFFSAICLIFFLMGDQSKNALDNRQLVSDIQRMEIATGISSSAHAIDSNVLRAMVSVPRHRFINERYHSYVYQNIALPLDEENRYMTEPFITALMLNLMRIDKTDRVLEIGFGTGYETAVMSKLAGKVYSVHQIEPFNNPLNNYIPIEKLGYKNVSTRSDTGLNGWPNVGQFDAILVKQSMTAPPRRLLEQLKTGGRLVIPIGSPFGLQRIKVYYKLENGLILVRPTIHVKISPLLTGHEI